MFNFLKPKYLDPLAIADSIFTVATDEKALTECYGIFATASDYRKRVNLGAVCFVYSCAYLWAASKNDMRILTACTEAVEIIPSRLKNPDKYVRIGDYIVSQYEAAMFPSLLETEFGQRISISHDASSDPKNISNNISKLVQNQEMPMIALAKAMLILRHQQFEQAIESTSNISDIIARFGVLAACFDEQVSGYNAIDTMHDPESATKQQMRALRGSLVLHNYLERIVARLTE